MKNYNKMYDEPEFTTAEFVDEVTVEETPTYSPEPTAKEEIGTVNAREVYIRRGPSKNEDHLGTVKKGDCLIVLGRENNFLKVETQDGVQAYIMEQFVDITN